MAAATVYAIPLVHTDANEYMRIRRGIEMAGGGTAAYELPRNALTEYLFRDVLGKSGRELDKEICKALGSLSVEEGFMSTVISDLEELDRARHDGKISRIYPIDAVIDDKKFVDLRVKLTRAHERLFEAINNGSPFLDVVKSIREVLLSSSRIHEMREEEMKDNVEKLASKDGKLLLMTGAMHLPNMERMLGKDGIAVVEVDIPEKVTGLWWLAFTASAEARSLDEGSYGPGLIRYSLLLGLTTIKEGMGLHGLTDSEARILESISSLDEASVFYSMSRRIYTEGKWGEELMINRLLASVRS
jgi:hypothetical protein